MQRRKVIRRSIIVAFLIVTMIPSVYVWKYKKPFPLLPIWNPKLSQIFESAPAQPLLPKIPVAVKIGPDNIVSFSKTAELTEEQKKLTISGLQLLFHAYANNLAYYFEYFSIIESGNGDNISAIILVFSHEPPRVSVEGRVREVNWTGQRISFDLIKLLMVYAVDGVFQFDGKESLGVRIFYSKSLKPKQPKLDQQKPPGEIFYKYPSDPRGSFLCH